MTTTVDSIVRQVILEKGLTLHDYIRFLSWGLNCLKEIQMDANMGDVKTTQLQVDEFSQAPLPCDYVDYVRIGEPNGQYLWNLGPNNRYVDSRMLVDGQYQPRQDGPYDVSFYWSSIYIQDWFDKYGEYRGRNFGGNGTRNDTFKVMKDRIQFNNNYEAGRVLTMDYLSKDPSDASSNVHAYAEEAVKAYMEYRYICHLPRQQAYDKASYKEAYELAVDRMHARLNDLTPEYVRRINHQYFKQTTRF